MSYSNDTIYVVELSEFVVITSFNMEEVDQCIYPVYKFDRKEQRAYVACEDIALKRGKKVADMLGFPPHSPHIYDPAKTRRQTKSNMLELENDYVKREKQGFNLDVKIAERLKHIIV